jgi:8-oxo-dGTP diphosphatase
VDKDIIRFQDYVESRTGESNVAKPFRLAVKAVIFDEQGRCLLIRRSNQCRNFVGQWEWPGGKVDPGEDFADAVVREAKEESSLDVEITGLAGATQFEMPTVNVVLLCMETRLNAGKVRLSEEHDDFAWVPLSDLGKWDIVESAKPLMLEYAKRKGTAP